MVNPYESPRGELGEDASTPKARRASRPYFTHILLNGCNLLGVTNLFAFIGLLWLVVAIDAPANNALRGVVLALAASGCMLWDLAVRVLTVRESRLIRLLSPYAGGTLVFIPVWAVYLAGFVTMAVIILTR